VIDSSLNSLNVNLRSARCQRRPIPTTVESFLCAGLLLSPRCQDLGWPLTAQRSPGFADPPGGRGPAWVSRTVG